MNGRDAALVLTIRMLHRPREFTSPVSASFLACAHCFPGVSQDWPCPTAALVSAFLRTAREFIRRRRWSR